MERRSELVACLFVTIFYVIQQTDSLEIISNIRKSPFFSRNWLRNNQNYTKKKSDVIVEEENTITFPEDWLHKPIRPSPEVDLSSVEIILSRGYPVEMHPVTTEDGYILMLHRIPHGRKQSSKSGVTGSPVFIHHGITSSSACWLITPSNRSLAFQLADLGYDVWLGNARGNTYSRNHVTLDPWHDDSFWDFSFDEMGRYDLPAAINYVLETTKRDTLSYIGVSMGTTIFFISMDYHPELNEKINVMMAMGPVANLGHMRSALRYIAPFARPIHFMLSLFGTREFMSQKSPTIQQQKAFCTSDIRSATLCQNVAFLMLGADAENMDINLLPIIDSHLPSGTSVKTVAHFAQIYNTGGAIARFNYGWLGNWRRYGNFNPSPYDLSKVTAPVYLFYGEGDLVATPENVEWLASKLPNLQKSIKVDDPKFNHQDFLYSTNVNRVLYDKLIGLLPPAVDSTNK